MQSKLFARFNTTRHLSCYYLLILLSASCHHNIRDYSITQRTIVIEARFVVTWLVMWLHFATNERASEARTTNKITALVSYRLPGACVSLDQLGCCYATHYTEPFQMYRFAFVVATIHWLLVFIINILSYSSTG